MPGNENRKLVKRNSNESKTNESKGCDMSMMLTQFSQLSSSSNLQAMQKRFAFLTIGYLKGLPHCFKCGKTNFELLNIIVAEGQTDYGGCICERCYGICACTSIYIGYTTMFNNIKAISLYNSRWAVKLTYQSVMMHALTRDGRKEEVNRQQTGNLYRCINTMCNSFHGIKAQEITLKLYRKDKNNGIKFDKQGRKRFNKKNKPYACYLCFACSMKMLKQPGNSLEEKIEAMKIVIESDVYDSFLKTGIQSQSQNLITEAKESDEGIRYNGELLNGDLTDIIALICKKHQTADSAALLEIVEQMKDSKSKIGVIP